MQHDPRACLWDVQKAIAAFRSVLIHGYAAVNQQTVWNTVQVALPPLLASVQALLQELSEA